MKLSSQQQIENLARFKDGRYLTTSFYLNTDKSQLIKKEILVSAKNLVTAAGARLEGMNLEKDQKASVCRDMDKILEFCILNQATSSKGFGLFSCQGENFWEEILLPHPPRNRLILDHNPYVRPLSQILGRYRRICVFLISRKEAKWHSVYMGEISHLETMTADVPKQVRTGGFMGTESQHIQRHIEAHLEDLVKKAAQRTFELFKRDHFDWLFLSCEDSFHEDLERFLHPYLRERLKSRLRVKTTDSSDKILKETLALEEQLNLAAEEETVRRFVAELERGGGPSRASRKPCAGLNVAEVQTLLVSHNFGTEGKIRPAAGFSMSTKPSVPRARSRPIPCRTLWTRRSSRPSGCTPRRGTSRRPRSSTTTARSEPS